MINRTLANRYRIERLVGQGGMADVYLALDMLLERDVAIKILRGELANDAVALLRFKHEAVAVSKLSHPNIIEIYDVGEEDNLQYIVMEYIDGSTLKELIQRRGGLYKEEAVSIMKQLTSAVAEAHRNGIIHRDIKPQNVLVKSDGSVKITDFGIALAQNALQLTQADSVMGSVHYLAPELARGEKATYQSDIYALGIVFYELLAGTVPFQGESAVQIAMMQIKDEMPSIREFNPSIPQSIENVILKATFKNKHQRYLTADDMLFDLQTVFDSDRHNEKPVEFEADNSDKTKILPAISEADEYEDVDDDEFDGKKKKLKTWQKVLISVLVVALLVGGGAFWYFGNKKPEEIVMPDLSGLTMDEARNKIIEMELEVGTIDRKLNDDVESDHVISYEPIKDTKVKKGDKVNFVISKGKWFVIEDYSGQSLDTVRTMLEQSSKVRVHAEFVDSKEIQPGLIISQSLLNSGDKVDPNVSKDIKFIVSKDVEISIPDLIGKKVTDAQNQLTELNVDVELVKLPTDNMTEEQMEELVKDEVVKTDPVKGSIYTQTPGSKIKIYHY